MRVTHTRMDDSGEREWLDVDDRPITFTRIEGALTTTVTYQTRGPHTYCEIRRTDTPTELYQWDEDRLDWNYVGDHWRFFTSSDHIGFSGADLSDLVYDDGNILMIESSGQGEGKFGQYGLYVDGDCYIELMELCHDGFNLTQLRFLMLGFARELMMVSMERSNECNAE